MREVAKSSNILQDNANVYYDTSQVESMAANMDGFLEQIREMDRQGTRMFIEIGEKSSELGEAVRDLAAGVRFHIEVADRLEATRAALEEVRSNSRTTCLWIMSRRARASSGRSGAIPWRPSGMFMKRSSAVGKNAYHPKKGLDPVGVRMASETMSSFSRGTFASCRFA